MKQAMGEVCLSFLGQHRGASGVVGKIEMLQDRGTVVDQVGNR